MSNAYAILQYRAKWWHMERFPDAQSYNVMIKATEELGEVARAVNGDLVGDPDRDRRGTAPEEAADVVITLMALLGRWYPEYELLDMVEKKLAILCDPNSGHRSALRGMNR